MAWEATKQKGEVRTGGWYELADICILKVLDLLTQNLAFEKGEKNGFHAPLMTSLNFLLLG